MYLDNNIYHIYNRGAHRLNIYHSEYQYYYFLQLLEKYKAKYLIEILAYCLMPNHYHLILKQNENGSISRFIQTACNAYVQAFNKMEGHSGTIFQGAVKGIAVESDEYLIQLILYIHNNPVAAGLVKRPELWTFSDYREWIDIKPFCFDGKALRDIYFIESKEYFELMKVYKEDKNIKYSLD
jgi:REP element-mobilizing transposase RayT